MSHTTEVVYVPELDKKFLTHNDIIRAALDIWNEDEDEENYYYSPSVGRVNARELTTQEHAYALLNNVLKVNSDNSVIIPVVAAKDAANVKKKFSLSVEGKHLVKSRRDVFSSPDPIEEAVRKVAGPNLISFTITKRPKPRKAVATATEGKAVTKYQVVGSIWGNGGYQVLAVKDSQAEARAEALALLNAEGSTWNDLEIHAQVVREGNEKALVKLSRPIPEMVTIEVEATLAKVKPNAKRAGYVVAFDAHH